MINDNNAIKIVNSSFIRSTLIRATFYSLVGLMTLSAIAMPAAEASTNPIVSSSVADKFPTDAETNLIVQPTDTIETNSPASSYKSTMSPAQRRSYKLLVDNYRQCFYVEIKPNMNVSLNHNLDSSPSSINSLATNTHQASNLPINYSIIIYENHNTHCDGDPNTMPRRASYLLDKYGRLFKHNVASATLDLQYQFNETAVIIDPLHKFDHPTATVFRKHQVSLTKVEKLANNTFVIFYVSDLPTTSSELESLSKQLTKANGGWDFIIRTEAGGEYLIEGSKRRIIDVDSYQKNDSSKYN